MIFIFLIINTILYQVYHYFSFNDEAKTKWWYIPLGLLIAIAGNLLWLIFSKYTTDTKTIFLGGIAWDSLIALTLLATPFVFYGFKLDKVGVLGFVFVVVGMVIMKLSTTIGG